MERTTPTSFGPPTSSRTSRQTSSGNTSLSNFSLLNRLNSPRRQEVGTSQNSMLSNLRPSTILGGSEWDHVSVSSNNSHRNRSSENANLRSPAFVSDTSESRAFESENQSTIVPGTPSIIRISSKNRSVIVALPNTYTDLENVTKRAFQLPNSVNLIFSTQIVSFGDGKVEFDRDAWFALKDQVTTVWFRENSSTFAEVGLKSRYRHNTPVSRGPYNTNIHQRQMLSRWAATLQMKKRKGGHDLYTFHTLKSLERDGKFSDICVVSGKGILRLECPPRNQIARIGSKREG